MNWDISILFKDLKLVEKLPPMGAGVWFGGWVGWLVGSGQITKKLSKIWPNWDNSIVFEDLGLVETPPPVGGCMAWWVGCYVRSCQITKNSPIRGWGGLSEMSKEMSKMSIIEFSQLDQDLFDFSDLTWGHPLKHPSTHRYLQTKWNYIDKFNLY